MYLPQWDAGGGPPAMLRLRSLDDLALLGVDAANYGDLVLDAAAWEQRYAVSLDRARFNGDLVLPEPVPTPSPTPDVEIAPDRAWQAAAGAGVAQARRAVLN